MGGAGAGATSSTSTSGYGRARGGADADVSTTDVAVPAVRHGKGDAGAAAEPVILCTFFPSYFMMSSFWPWNLLLNSARIFLIDWSPYSHRRMACVNVCAFNVPIRLDFSTFWEGRRVDGHAHDDVTQVEERRKLSRKRTHAPRSFYTLSIMLIPFYSFLLGF